MIVTRSRRPVQGGAPSNDQVRIAELVPEISALPRFGVGPFEVAGRSTRRRCSRHLERGRHAAATCFEHRQMRGLRLVQSGDQAADRAQRPLRRDHEARSIPRRETCPAFVGHGLERADDRRAHRDDARPARLAALTRSAVSRGTR